MFAEELDPFFDTDDFAVAATFTRDGDEVAAAAVIFNGPGHQVTVYETAVEEPAPFLLAPAASVADVRRNDEAAVEGQGSFVVERVEPDGTGLTRLYLSEA